MSSVRERVKPWILPLAMVGGIFFHEFIERISFLSPYLIFTMLLITFCKVDIKNFTLSRLSWWLLSVQTVGAVLVYIILSPLGGSVAQGAFMCVFCPVATAAPVITGMLGGSVSRLAAFSMLSNMAVALLAPLLFSVIGTDVDMRFCDEVITIGERVVPLIILPLLIALLLKRFLPRLHREIASRQSMSFYIWAVALFIVVGRAVAFIISEPAELIPQMVIIAVCAATICCLQFYFGRKMGGICGDKIVGGQGLGQKNTVLAVWMSLTYLDPISSIGPASYVLWQNTINSWQLYRKSRSID